MSEDHATPPTEEERERAKKSVQAAGLTASLVVVGILAFMLEFGGDMAENIAVGIFVVAAITIWWRQRR